MTEPPLTLAQLAARLQVSTRTVRRLIAAGQIRVTYVGRSPRVTVREVEAYENAAYRRGRVA